MEHDLKEKRIQSVTSPLHAGWMSKLTVGMRRSPAGADVGRFADAIRANQRSSKGN